MLRTFGLYAVTAVAEIVGCWLPMLWMRKTVGVWALVPAAIALAAFVWLLSLHPAASGRVYAAYGGVYVAVALAWLWLVDGIRPGPWDVIGVAAILAGAALIVLAPRLSS